MFICYVLSKFKDLTFFTPVVGASMKESHLFWLYWLQSDFVLISHDTKPLERLALISSQVEHVHDPLQFAYQALVGGGWWHYLHAVALSLSARWYWWHCERKRSRWMSPLQLCPRFLVICQRNLSLMFWLMKFYTTSHYKPCIMGL